MRSTTSIDEVLKAAADHGDVPGVVAMAANRDGLLYEGAFGRRALPDGAAMTADTVFWIASMTKAITSAAAMQLVEQGKLVLDEPIADILPELAQPQVLEGFDAAGEPHLRPARRAITLRHLITHTSGFVYDIWNPEMGRYMERKGIPGIITCRNAALDLPLVFDPGDAWDYGIGIDWVGKAVERASGQQLGEYFAEHLFESSRNEGYRLQIDPGAPYPAGKDACTRRGRHARTDPIRDPAGPGVPDGWGRTVQHSSRLSRLSSEFS